MAGRRNFAAMLITHATRVSSANGVNVAGHILACMTDATTSKSDTLSLACLFPGTKPSMMHQLSLTVPWETQIPKEVRIHTYFTLYVAMFCIENRIAVGHVQSDSQNL